MNFAVTRRFLGRDDRSVDLAAKRITVEVRKQGEKVFVCDEKSAITFTGPILDHAASEDP